MGFSRNNCLLSATLAILLNYIISAHESTNSSSVWNSFQHRSFRNESVENLALNFLRRFTCYTNCIDLHDCISEEDAHHLESFNLTEDSHLSTLSLTLVNHVLRLNARCENEARRYLATERFAHGEASTNHLKPVLDSVLQHLKLFYQPLKANECFSSRDLFHDLNSNHSKNVFSEKTNLDVITAMFLRLSAGDCIEVEEHVIFIEDIFSRYNNNGTNSLDETGLKQLMSDMGIVRHDHDHSHEDEHNHDHNEHGQDDHNHQHEHHVHLLDPKRSKRDITEYSSDTDLKDHLNTSQCLEAHHLLHHFDRDLTGNIDQNEFLRLCPVLIQQRLHGSCTEKRPPVEKTAWEVYGYGTIAVLIISLCSTLGAILMPIQNTSFYEYLMMCFIALAFGTLTGDALLHLIPEAVGLHNHGEEDHDHQHEEGLPPYFWKLFVLLVSVYGLFVFEGLAALAVNGIRSEGKKSHGHSHVPSIDLVQMTRKDGKSVSSETLESRITNSGSLNGDVPPGDHQTSVSAEKPKMCCGMTTLALVIIIGDAIHNVADGLTIGAAFSSDVKGGISSALAIFFHELPHEFGDFVILLSTGFTFKKALIWNFIASLTAFIGLYVGIEIGENEEARQWILTVAAGMFLYIALGDMLPELKEQKGKNGLIAFFVQNLGVLCGMIFMILMSVYEDQIKV